jgi:hypothetical protein
MRDKLREHNLIDTEEPPMALRPPAELVPEEGASAQ